MEEALIKLQPVLQKLKSLDPKTFGLLNGMMDKAQADGHREADGQPWIWRARTSWVRRRCVALATSSGRAGRLVAAGTDAADHRRVVRQDREPTRDAGVVATRGAAVRAAGMSRASTQRLRSQRSSVAARAPTLRWTRGKTGGLRRMRRGVAAGSGGG